MTDEIRNEDFSGKTFRVVNFANSKMVDADMMGARFSGRIDGLQINGIEVAPLIAAEMRRLYPERDQLFAADPAGFRRALAQYEALLKATLDRARGLTEEQRHERVDGEWSVVETIRHLIFVIDGWISRTVLGESDPFHPIGLPPSFIPADAPGTSIDPAAQPSFDEALEVWRGRMDVLRRVIEGLTPEELERHVETAGPGYPPAGLKTQVIGPLWTVFSDGWSHNLFMNRDMDTLTAAQ